MRAHFRHALATLEGQLFDLGAAVQQAVHTARWAFEHDAAGFARQVIASDDAIDALRYTVEQAALTLIARQHPLAGDLRTVSALLGLASELERIGDYAEGIAGLVLRIAEQPPLAPPPALSQMADQAEAMLSDALAALQQRDSGAAIRLEAADCAVDALNREIIAWAFESMHRAPLTIERATYYMWVAHNFERIADRTINIGERTAFITTGLFDPQQ